MRYKIVVFDIGKTLLDKRFSQKISEQTLIDIKALKQKGIKVGVCTMRTVQHCREIIPFELDFYICLNGSYIICDGNIIFDSPIHYLHNTNEYLSYGADFAFYSNEAAKQKALSNGFLIDKCGIANPMYNLVLFDIALKPSPCKAQILLNCLAFKEYWIIINWMIQFYTLETVQMICRSSKNLKTVYAWVTVIRILLNIPCFKQNHVWKMAFRMH